MTPIEWIAMVIATWVFIKFLIMTFNPKGYIDWAFNVWKKHSKFIRYLYLILFLVTSYFVLQEINVVSFFVAMIAGMAIVAHTMSHYPKVTTTYIDQFKGKNPNTKIMLDWLIWLLIAAWVLKTLFF
tara:strand:- start:727 stop:1107 length:381 start_codon:yes stop_codon:yes gene_type:complete